MISFFLRRQRFLLPFVFGLVFFFGFTATAHAGKLSGVKVTPASTTANTTTTWTFEMTTETAAPVGSFVTIYFPYSTSLSGNLSDIIPTSTDLNGTGSGAPTFTSDGSSASGTYANFKISGAGFNAGDSITFGVRNVNNGNQQGNLMGQIATLDSTYTLIDGGDQPYSYANYSVSIGTIQVIGRVMDPTATTGIANANVSLRCQDWTCSWFTNTNTQGNFSFSGLGTKQKLTLEVFLNNSIYGNPQKVENISTTEGQQTNLGNILATSAAFRGVAKNPSGQALQNARVYIEGQFSANAFSGQDGAFALSGVASGTYKVCFENGWDQTFSGLVPPECIERTYDGSTTVNLGDVTWTAASKTLNVTVQYSDTQTKISGAEVMAMKEMGGGFSRSTTNAQGLATLSLSGGNFRVDVKPPFGGQSVPDWIISGPPVQVSFANDKTSETKSLTIEVTRASVTVTGSVTDPNGNAVSQGVNVNINQTKGFGTNCFVQMDASFTCKVAPGSYSAVANSWNSSYGSSLPKTFTAEANTTQNLGKLALRSKQARITGKLVDTSGNPVANEAVSAFQSSGEDMKRFGMSDFSHSQSASDGTFTLNVVGPGTYSVQPDGKGMMDGGFDKDKTNYVYTGSPVIAELTTATSTYSNANFTLSIANATINCRAVISGTTTVISDLFGFAFVNSSGKTGFEGMFSGLGAPVNNGSCTLKVPAGTYRVGIGVPPGSAYSSGGTVSVTVTDGGSTNADIPMVPNNVTVQGSLKDQNGAVVTGLRAEVFAEGPNFSFGAAQVDPSSGNYTLKISAGKWVIGYHVDPASGYVSQEGQEITVEANKTYTVHLTVKKSDSTISGQVLDPSGNGLPYALVAVDSKPRTKTEKNDTSFSFLNFMMGNTTDPSGKFTINVPAGTYYISAASPSAIKNNWLNPGVIQRTVSPSTPANNLILQFTKPDSTLSGKVDGTDSSGNNIDTSGSTLVAFSSGGRYTETTVNSDETYSIPVVSGETWNLVVGEIEDDNDINLSKIVPVEIPAGDTSETKNVTVEQLAWDAPEDVTLTFSANSQVTLTNNLGDTLTVPSGAVDTSGNVTCSMAPQISRFTDDNKAIKGYDLDVTCRDSNGGEVSSLNNNLTVTQEFTQQQQDYAGIPDSALTGEIDCNKWDEDNQVYQDCGTTTVSIGTGTTDSTITTSIDTLSTFSLGSSSASLPVITISSPANGAIVQGTSATVTGTVSDPSATVTIKVGGTSVGAVTVGSNGSFSKDVTLSSGSNTITTDASNSLGSALQDSRTVTVTTTATDVTPVVTAINPNYAYNNVATNVKITGTDFATGATVKIGSTAMTSVTVDSATQISATIPSGVAAGTYDVVVTNPNSKSGTLSSAFILLSVGQTFPAPTIKSVSPKTIRSGQNNSVVIAGTNFLSGAKVSLNGTDISNVTVNSADKITILVPSTQSTGTYTVKVLNTDGQSVTQTDALIVASEMKLLVTPNNPSGSQMRVYKIDGTLYGSFFAYAPSLRGEFHAVAADVTGDGIDEIVTWAGKGFGPQIRVFTGKGTLVGSFTALHSSFRGGVNVSVGDVNNDGKSDIVVTAAQGGGSQVSVFHYDAASASKFLLLAPAFPAYDAKYRGGLRTMVVNVDGDNNRDIVVSPEGQKPSNIRAYEFNGSQFVTLAWVMAFGKFMGGVEVSAGDVNGDGDYELVVSPRAGGGPNVRIYDYASGSFKLMDSFMAYSEKFRGGVKTTIGDINGDGADDFVTLPLGRGTANMRVYYWTGSKFALLDWVDVFGGKFRGETSIDTGDLDGDGKDEIVVVPAVGAASNLRVYRYSNNDLGLVTWMFAYGSKFMGGVGLHTADIDIDGKDEIITFPLGLGAANVRLYDLTNNALTLQKWFQAYDSKFRNGVNVSAMK